MNASLYLEIHLLFGGSQFDDSDGVLGESYLELLLDGAVVLGVGYYGFGIAHAVTVATESSKRSGTSTCKSLGLRLSACVGVLVTPGSLPWCHVMR